MKKFLSVMACLVMVLVGGVALAACGDSKDKIPSDAKYISNSTELVEAINNQKDNEYWVLEAGTYDLDPNATTIIYGDQTGWYLPIVANGITIRGEGDVTLMSTHDTPNAAWASQNFITVVGDNVTIKNLTVVCKKEVNKAVEVLGKNVTIKDMTFNAPSDYDFAGSIYFNQQGIDGNEAGDVGTVTLENVNLNKGRITASGASTGTIKFNNVKIDWTGIEEELIAGFYPMLNFNNEGKTFTYEGASTVEVKMSETEMGAEYETAVANLIKGVKLVNVDA